MKRKRGSVLPLRRQTPLAKEIADEMAELVEATVQSAETGAPSPDLYSCLRAAVDVSEWMRHVKEKTTVQSSLYVPKALKALGDKAAEGDVNAARLLFDYLNLMPKKGAGVTVATQINISPQELEEIKREIGDVEEV